MKQLTTEELKEIWKNIQSLKLQIKAIEDRLTQLWLHRED